MMKKLLFTTMILFTGIASVIAQSPTTSFDVAGIKVIFKPTLKNVINVRVYYRGGVTNYPAAKAGIEALTLNAATQCGTAKYNTNSFRDTCDKYDILVSGVSSYDYGYIQVNSINKYFNKAWDLFTDAVINPVFDPKELALLKTKTIQGNKAYYSRPENIFNDLQMKNGFANTPYSVNPTGTEETINALTVDDVKEYYKTLLNKNRIFIVVVGKITKDELYEKILAAFSSINAQPYTPADLTTPDWIDNRLVSEQRDLKINYVGAMMNTPDFSSPAYVPFRIAMSGIGGNLYMYLRSIRVLSYNPDVATVSLRMPYVAMTASSSDPKQVMLSMLDVLKHTQKNGYDDEWLEHIKNGYITTNYVNEQSAAQITNNLGLAEILGNWHFADDLPQLVNMVTVDQLNQVINYYIKGLRWTYVGDTKAIEGFIPPPY